MYDYIVYMIDDEGEYKAPAKTLEGAYILANCSWNKWAQIQDLAGNVVSEGRT